LKTAVSCLVALLIVVILALPHWHTNTELTGQMRKLATQSQNNIVSAPATIVYSIIESAIESINDDVEDPLTTEDSI
jgi:hypothetical protein